MAKKDRDRLMDDDDKMDAAGMAGGAAAGALGGKAIADRINPEAEDAYWRGNSRLSWPEARIATRDAWQRTKDTVERAMPGDADHDGK